MNMDKLRSTLRQIVRDWSEEGRSEREETYKPLLDALENWYQKSYAQSSQRPRHELRVLVPGAGLGRLAVEVALAGYSCEGNEFSFFMLLTSNFLLNRSV